MIQYVTETGTRALARALSESAEITFTRCVVGDGVFAGDEAAARAMTGLVSQKATADVSIVRAESDGVAVVADMNNTVIPGGTAIREMGLYAKLNAGAEFMFSYGYSSTIEVVPTLDEGTYERRFVTHIVMTDDEAELTVQYDTMTDAFSGASEWRAAVDNKLAALGSASKRDFAATVANDATLPTGAAVVSYVSTAISGKADSATTLAGYGIADAYTKAEVDGAIAGAIAGLYEFKGSVATYADLPEGAAVGDVYNVIAEYQNIPAGTNYAWTGTDWDALGGEIDLSGYVAKEDGKGLSANDFTDADKAKLANINGAIYYSATFDGTDTTGYTVLPCLVVNTTSSEMYLLQEVE